MAESGKSLGREREIHIPVLSLFHKLTLTTCKKIAATPCRDILLSQVFACVFFLSLPEHIQYACKRF